MISDKKLTDIFVSMLRNKRDSFSYFRKELEEAGVSVGFLAFCMMSNIDEFIVDMMKFASAQGELLCLKCDDYFNYAQAVLDATDGPQCPRCGQKLEQAICSECGDALYRGEAYVGVSAKGRICCPQCASKLKKD